MDELTKSILNTNKFLVEQTPAQDNEVLLKLLDSQASVVNNLTTLPSSDSSGKGILYGTVIAAIICLTCYFFIIPSISTFTKVQLF